MTGGPALSVKSQVSTSLQNSAASALDEYGPCQVPLKKGALQITELGDGAVGIQGLSSKDSPRFSLSLKDGVVSYASSTHRDAILSEYGSEREFLGKLDQLIQNALSRESITSLPYPPEADPSQGELRNRPSAINGAPSLQEEIAQAWNTVNRVLTTPEGAQIGSSVTGLDIQHNRPTFNLHIRRLRAPDTIELEMISMSHRRDVFFDDRIVVTPKSIVFNLADSSEPFQDERYALKKLADWLERVKASSSSS